MHDVLDPDDGRAGGVNFLDRFDELGAFMLGQTAGNLVSSKSLGWVAKARASSRRLR